MPVACSRAPGATDLPPPSRLALLTARHLTQPDWPAYTDDFLLPPYAPDEALARLSLLAFRQRHVRSGDTLLVSDLFLDYPAAAPATPRAASCR